MEKKILQTVAALMLTCILLILYKAASPNLDFHSVVHSTFIALIISVGIILILITWYKEINQKQI